MYRKTFLLNVIVLKFLSGLKWFPRRKVLRSQTKELDRDLSSPCAQIDQRDDSSIMTALDSVIMEVGSDINCFPANMHLNLNYRIFKMLYSNFIVHNYFIPNP